MGRLMNYIQEALVDNEVTKNEKNEERQTKKKLKTAKGQLKEMTTERDLYRDKYITLLEEKGEGFNQYLYWQNKSNETEAEEKELRKEIADFKKDFKDYNDVISKLFNKDEVTSLSKCENLDDFLAYALRLYFKDKDLPLKGISETCKKLDITKFTLKKESEFLYKMLNVDKWDID